MKRHIRGRHRAAYLCALLAGLLLCLSGARADLLLFATAEDCESALVAMIAEVKARIAEDKQKKKEQLGFLKD